MKTYTEEQLLKTLKAWGVSDEEQQALIADMGGEEDTDAKAEGGEPEAVVEDKAEEKVEEEVAEGGEPEAEQETPTETEKPDQSNDIYKAKFDELSSRIDNIIASLEGLSAANKRNEEIIGSLGKTVDGTQSPYGGVTSSQEKDVKKSAKESADETLDYLGRLAGKR